MLKVLPGGHCLRCHKDYPKGHKEHGEENPDCQVILPDGSWNKEFSASPCTASCGKWYKDPKGNYCPNCGHKL